MIDLLIRDNTAGIIVRRIVERYIYPFQPGLSEIYLVDDSMGQGRNIIVLNSKVFPDFVLLIDDSILLGLNSENELPIYIGEQAGAYYRSLMNEPIPNTVVLGEN